VIGCIPATPFSPILIRVCSGRTRRDLERSTFYLRGEKEWFLSYPGMTSYARA